MGLLAAGRCRYWPFPANKQPPTQSRCEEEAEDSEFQYLEENDGGTEQVTVFEIIYGFKQGTRRSFYGMCHPRSFDKDSNNGYVI